MIDYLYVLYRSFRRRLMNGKNHIYASGEKWSNPMRRKMSRRKSRKNFKRNAGTHPKNMRTNQRGGYRL